MHKSILFNISLTLLKRHNAYTVKKVSSMPATPCITLLYTCYSGM